MNLAMALVRQAQRQPDGPAVWWGARPWCTHGEWARRAASWAAHWRHQGLQAGDRVAWFATNHPVVLEWMWGAWWAGLVAVPINPKLHPQEVQWIVSDAQAGWLGVSADLNDPRLAQPLPEAWGANPPRRVAVHVLGVDASPADTVPRGSAVDLDPPWPCQPTDTAWLFYTSGTTGKPKGVMISHLNLRTMGLAYAMDIDAVGAHHTMVYAAPLSHGAGLYAVPHVMAGARHVVPASGGVDAAELWALAQAHGPLSTFAAPTIVNRLVDFARHHLSPAQSRSWFRTLVYGGAPMYEADVRRALSVLGPCLVQIYGQGESPMSITVLPRSAHGADGAAGTGLTTVGWAQSSVEVQVHRAPGQPAATAEVGEVVVRGDTVMTGYWRQPEATGSALAGGWLHTGDLGSLDGQGLLTLKDRSKDLLISGGSNIYPREVEEVLLKAPGVREVAVVGEPDAQWGESVVAVVVMHEGEVLNPSVLDAHCLSQLARFKRPKRYVQSQGLPKNHYGKVLKRDLRQWVLSQPSAPWEPPPP